MMPTLINCVPGSRTCCGFHTAQMVKSEMRTRKSNAFPGNVSQRSRHVFGLIEAVTPLPVYCAVV